MPSSSARRRRQRGRDKRVPSQFEGVADTTAGAELPPCDPSAVHHELDRVPHPSALPNPNPPELQPHSEPSYSSRRRRRRRGRGGNKPPPAVSQPEEEADGTGCGAAELPQHELSAVHHLLDRILHSAVPNPNPPDTQPHRATLSSSRRRRGRRGRKGPVPATVEARDWTELPLDMLSAVLRKLDQIEVLMGAGHVCRSWRRATRDVPELWRRIDIRGHGEYNYDLCKIVHAAIRRSEGQCEAFWSDWAVDEDLLLFLGDRASSLKSLRLVSCHGLDNEGLANAINKFGLLEELELSLCSNISGNRVFEAVATACPQLRRFRLSNMRFFNYEDSENEYNFEDGDTDSEYKFNKDDDAQGIATMHELRSLQLFANSLTNEGLTAILDSCTHLESLDIRHCFNVTMTIDDALRAKCAKIKTLRLPYDSTDDYEFEVMRPLWSRSELLGIESDNDDFAYAPDYILDSDEYSDYLDPNRYLDGVYIGRRVTIMDLLDADF